MAFGVRLEEELLGYLSKFADCYLSNAHFVLSFVVLEEIVLVALIMVKIIVFFCIVQRGFVAEDEVDPEVELCADEV